MIQLKLALIGVGGFLGFMGFQDIKLASATDKEPTTISLSEIEGGTKVENANVVLTGYFPAMHELIYETSDTSANPSPGASVSVSYVPLIAEDNKYVMQLVKAFESENFSNVPKLNSFKVIVKTDRFKNVGQLETGDFEDEVKGIFINKVEKLGAEETSLLKQSFPTMNFDNVLILEEGRKPASSVAGVGKMGGGGIVSLLGLGWLFGGFGRKK